MWAILSEPGTLEMLTCQAAEITEGNCLAKLGLLDDPTARIFAIEAEGVLVGMEALAHIDWQNKSAVIPCIAITRHGNQYGLSATRALVRHAFDTLGLHRVSYTSIHPDALKRARALGARFEGTEVAAIWKDGKWHNRNRFAFLKEG
mgnify:CR=1 FL=1